MAKTIETSKGESCDCGSCGQVCRMHFCSKCGVAALIFGALFLVAGLGLYTASWFNTNTIAGAFLAIAGVMAITGMSKM